MLALGKTNHARCESQLLAGFECSEAHDCSESTVRTVNIKIEKMSYKYHGGTETMQQCISAEAPAGETTKQV
jgi:hypothetical protein